MSFSYSTVIDRIYKRYESIYDNIAYLHHPSGVSVIVLRQIPDSEVVEVDFGSHKKKGVDRSDNTVVGKGKKGGLQLQKETRLCTIRCKDGQEIIIRAGLRGTLAELNTTLKLKPDLVRTAPENQGYIGIVTFGAGKRKPDELITELPPKRVFLQNPSSVETKVEQVTSVPLEEKKETDVEVQVDQQPKVEKEAEVPETEQEKILA